MDRRPANTTQQEGATAEPEEGVHQRDTVPAPPPPEAIGPDSSTVRRLDETPLMVETHARDAYLHSLGKRVGNGDEPDVEQERPTARPTWDSEPTALFDATDLVSSERSITIPPPPPLPSGEWAARNTPLVNPTVTREEALADEGVGDAERETAPGDLSVPIAASALPDADEDDPTLPRTSHPELIPPPPAGEEAALALSSLAPITRSRAPAVPAVEPSPLPRRLAIAFAAAAVLLLGVSWALDQRQPEITSTPLEPRPAAAVPELESVTATEAAAEPEPAPVTEPAPESVSATAPRAPMGRARRRVEAHAPDPATLPEIPTRESVVAGLEAIRPALAACSEGRGGIAQLDLSIVARGRVAHAVVGGDYAGTPQGSCIARAVRKARFDPFQRERFRILYPFAF